MHPRTLLTVAIVASFSLQARESTQILRNADLRAADPGVSPVLRIQGSQHPSRAETNPGPGFRRLDGSGNNLRQPDMGAAGTQLRRWVPADYADLKAQPAGPQRLSARAVSNIVSDQDGSIPNSLRVSDFLWQWGQFLDHDIDLTDGTNPPEPMPISVPLGDPEFDPSGSGVAVIPFNRSLFDPATGSDAPRQQINQITAWIDASNVYGADAERAAALRENDGSGRLKTSGGDLLPFNTAGLANAGGNGADLFLAGDVRANEQVGLTVMHTLFVREHNRLAAEIAANNPGLSGDQIYQRARRLVGAMMQAITYREYLPALLGARALPPYKGYDSSVDAGIANLFSTASYRYGHSALSPTLLRLDANGQPIAAGNLAMRDAFFSPSAITAAGGLAPYLRGLAAQQCQDVDLYVIDDMRNFLFGDPGQGGFDLVALNIQRGRDHGLPSYNTVRRALGLPPKSSFADISSDPRIQARLKSAYTLVDDVDLWVGGLAEDHLPGTMVGELIHTVLVRQFTALRDGDRFWYERTLSRSEQRLVNNSRLADIIRRNTDIGAEIGADVFHVPTNTPNRNRPGRR
jgi:peroxidase